MTYIYVIRNVQCAICCTLLFDAVCLATARAFSVLKVIIIIIVIVT